MQVGRSPNHQRFSADGGLELTEIGLARRVVEQRQVRVRTESHDVGGDEGVILQERRTQTRTVFELIEETLQNYEIDGFELQMYYLPHYFHPDELEAGRDIMTGWIRRIYEAVKKSGAQRELTIRIPNSIGDCLAMGMDLRAWIDQGIVDVLIAEERGGLGGTIVQPADFRPLV